MFMLNNSQSKCFHSEGCCAHPCGLYSSQHTSIRVFLSLIWWLIFFTVSHIFLFLCAPGKFGVDARCLGFYFLGYRVFCIPSCACSWAVCDSLQWLGPVEADWPHPGPVFPEGSTCGPVWAPFSTLAARRLSLILENSGGSGGSLHSRLLCPKYRALGEPPELCSFVLGLCPPSWHHILETPPMSQALLDHLYLFFYGMLSRTAQGTLSESHYFIYFIFCL